MMAGGDAAGFQHLDARCQPIALQVKFIQPAPGKMRQAVMTAARHMPTSREDALDGHRLIAEIGDYRPALDQVLAGVNAIVQIECEGVKGVFKMQNELGMFTFHDIRSIIRQHDIAHAAGKGHL
jgi:hypothetical protein